EAESVKRVLVHRVVPVSQHPAQSIHGRKILALGNIMAETDRFGDTHQDSAGGIEQHRKFKITKPRGTSAGVMIGADAHRIAFKRIGEVWQSRDKVAAHGLLFANLIAI